MDPAPTSAQDKPAVPSEEERPLIEIGWVVVGDVSGDVGRVARLGRAAFLRQVRSQFPGFRWKVPFIDVPQAPFNEATPEPVQLLDVALAEREGRRLDFALAVWPGEMAGYDRPHPLGAPSSIIACAAIALGRLMPLAADEDETGSEGVPADWHDALARAGDELRALACHLLGHLVGLGHAPEPTDFMHPPHDDEDLRRMESYRPETVERLREELADVADPRLEEREADADPVARDERHGLARFAGWGGRLRFALLAAWHNRRDVRAILSRVQPWRLPLRLGRLVTAAASTLVVLLMTAEAWEAGMSQPAWRLIVLSLIAIGVATAYLVNKQRLLVARPRRGRPSRHSEQRSVGNVAVVLAVLVGLVVTYAALFVAALVAAWLCYPAGLVENWAASVEQPTQFHHYLRLAAGVAALGLGIGVLGASFEPRGYVRHVAYVDEEV